MQIIILPEFRLLCHESTCFALNNQSHFRIHCLPTILLDYILQGKFSQENHSLQIPNFKINSTKEKGILNNRIYFIWFDLNTYKTSEPSTRNHGKHFIEENRKKYRNRYRAKGMVILILFKLQNNQLNGLNR